jgi:hypothetical protein
MKNFQQGCCFSNIPVSLLRENVRDWLFLLDKTVVCVIVYYGYVYSYCYHCEIHNIMHIGAITLEMG